MRRLSIASLFLFLSVCAAFFSTPAQINVGDSHGSRGVQHRPRSSQQNARHRGGRAETSLAAGGGAPPTDSRQEAELQQEQRQGLEKKRKLNPLETLLMVYTQTSARTDARPDRQYPFFTGLPLKPYFDRPTVRTEEIPGVMWAFEQPQEFFNVSVNIRMTAVRLEGGGLWVHAPIAPTEECVRLVEELGEEVRYIVLPTTAFEHKVYVKPFSDRFPRAQVYACPGQWSWPINLPPSFRVDGVLCEGERAPWEDEVGCKFFSSPIGGV
ncbi:unnamed protein product, partial [Ectocarpus fasciculatus]